MNKVFIDPYVPIVLHFIEAYPEILLIHFLVRRLWRYVGYLSIPLV
jgi:hypothetical protein